MRGDEGGRLQCLQRRCWPTASIKCLSPLQRDTFSDIKKVYQPTCDPDNMNEGRNNGPEHQTSSSLYACTCWGLFWLLLSRPGFSLLSVWASVNAGAQQPLLFCAILIDSCLVSRPCFFYFLPLLCYLGSRRFRHRASAHVCVCLPSLSPPYPSASSSCLGASASTAPVFRGTAAGHAPAARGTCPPGHTGTG